MSLLADGGPLKCKLDSILLCSWIEPVLIHMQNQRRIPITIYGKLTLLVIERFASAFRF